VNVPGSQWLGVVVDVSIVGIGRRNLVASGSEQNYGKAGEGNCAREKSSQCFVMCALQNQCRSREEGHGGAKEQEHADGRHCAPGLSPCRGIGTWVIISHSLTVD
jgi:hypothetical protein